MILVVLSKAMVYYFNLVKKNKNFSSNNVTPKTLGRNLIKGVSILMNIDKEVENCFRDNNTFYVEKKQILQSKSNSNNSKSIVSDTKKISINNEVETELKFTELPKKLKSFKKSLSDLSIDITQVKTSLLVIDLEGRRRIIWDYILFFMSLYSISISPIYFSYYEVLVNLKFIEIIIEFFFIMDVISNFLTSYKDKEDNMITQIIKIIQRYLKTWFFIDLLYIIPIEFISFFFLDHRGFFFFNWLKMLKISRFFKDQTNGRFLNKIVLSRNFKLNSLLYFLIIFFIIAHICSCFFIFLAKTSTDEINWINVNTIDTVNHYEVYVASLYFNLVTIYTIGYGDITPTNIYEKLWVSIFMIAGSMLFSYTISKLSLLFSENNNSIIDFKKKKRLFHSIIAEYEIPIELKIRIINTIKEQHKNNDNDRYEFLASLPSKTIRDLSMVMSQNTIQNHKFFKNQSHDFILYVLPLLKFQIIFKRDVLISVGEIMEEMYLILEGNLSFHLGEKYENLEIWEYGKNECYGDLLIQLSEQSPYEIRCKSNKSEIFILSKINFLKVKNEFTLNIFKIMEESYIDFKIIDKRTELYMKLFSKCENSSIFKKKMIKLRLELFDKIFLDYYYNDLDSNQFNKSNLKNEFKLATRIFKKINNPYSVKKSNKLSIIPLNVNNTNKTRLKTLVSNKKINKSLKDTKVLNNKNIFIEKEEEIKWTQENIQRSIYNQNRLNDSDNLIENNDSKNNIILKNNFKNDIEHNDNAENLFGTHKITKKFEYNTLNTSNNKPNITLNPIRSNKNLELRRNSHLLLNSNKKIENKSIKQDNATKIYNKIIRNCELMDSSVILLIFYQPYYPFRSKYHFDFHLNMI